MHREQILIVEDDPKLAQLLHQELQHEGYETHVAGTGGEALIAAETQNFAIILLDLNLPDFDGIEVAERLQGRTNASIIMLTARGEIKHRIEGLYAGAADYLVKPISIQELIARIHVRLREKTKPQTVTYGELTLNLNAPACTVAGKPLVLTKHEFELLSLLISNQGRIFSKDDLEQRLYGDDFRSSNTIEVFVSRLRTKLMEAGAPNIIQTIRGFGYVAA